MCYGLSDDEKKIIQDAIENNLVLIAGQPLPLFDLKDGNPVLSKGYESLREVMLYYKPDV